MGFIATKHLGLRKTSAVFQKYTGLRTGDIVNSWDETRFPPFSLRL